MSQASPKVEYIDLSAKYFLNKYGIDYCVGRRVPLRDMRDADGSRRAGFEWRRCSAASLERLVIGSLLSRIELDRPEFLSVRAPLISMTQSILHGSVIVRFREELRRRIASLPRAVKFLERPGAATALSDRKSVAEALRGRAPAIASVRRAALAECSRRAPSGAAEEREERLRLGAKLLGELDGESLILMSLSAADSAGPVADAVLAYAGRMALAEQLSLLLVEFVHVAEKSYFRSMADHDRYARSHPGELQRLLSEPAFRARLVEAGARRGDAMVLRVSFEDSADGRSEPGRMEIAVRTKGLIGRDGFAIQGARRDKSVRTTDLESLLKSAARDDEIADSSLAFYTNFEKACAKEGIAFVTRVLLDAMKNETTATMRIAV